MFPHRPLPWLMCALLVVVANSGPAFALQGLKAFNTAGPSFVVKIEGRKGTRIYRPDVSEDDDASTEPQETAEQAKEKLDQCMASWDTQTHITKANWRKICERELSDGGL